MERARKLIADSLTGYKIVNVDAKEDKIVYTGGTDHNDFVSGPNPSYRANER